MELQDQVFEIIRSFAVLRITSLRGRSFGAEHWYGVVHFKNDEREVCYAMTKEDCRRMNRKDRFIRARWMPGYVTNRCTTEQEVRRLALKMYRTEFQQAIGLLEGIEGCLSIQKVLYAPHGYKKRLNELYAQTRGRKWQTELDAINEQWCAMLLEMAEAMKRNNK